MGIETGGWGLQLRSEDIAKFGELYAEGSLGHEAFFPKAGSRWHSETGRQRRSLGIGRQATASSSGVACPKAFIGIAPTVILHCDAEAGYGCCHNQRGWRHARILNILWEELLPAIEDDALEADADAFDSLVSFSRNLVVRRSKTPGVALSSGYAGRYAMDSNDRKIAFVEFSELPAGVGLRLEHEDGNVTELRFGKDDFVVNARNWDAMDGETSAGAVSATGENSFKLDLLGLEGPFRVFWNCQWNQDGSLLIGARKNFCFFGAAQWPEMRGRKLQV